MALATAAPVVANVARTAALVALEANPAVLAATTVVLVGGAVAINIARSGGVKTVEVGSHGLRAEFYQP